MYLNIQFPSLCVFHTRQAPLSLFFKCRYILEADRFCLFPSFHKFEQIFTSVVWFSMCAAARCVFHNNRWVCMRFCSKSHKRRYLGPSMNNLLVQGFVGMCIHSVRIGWWSSGTHSVRSWCPSEFITRLGLPSSSTSPKRTSVDHREILIISR